MSSHRLSRAQIVMCLAFPLLVQTALQDSAQAVVKGQDVVLPKTKRQIRAKKKNRILAKGEKRLTNRWVTPEQRAKRKRKLANKGEKTQKGKAASTPGKGTVGQGQELEKDALVIIREALDAITTAREVAVEKKIPLEYVDNIAWEQAKQLSQQQPQVYKQMESGDSANLAGMMSDRLVEAAGTFLRVIKTKGPKRK